MKKENIKKGVRLKCKRCSSLLQKFSIEGLVFFDSWEGDDKCFVYVPGEPSGKRFLIKSDNLILEQ